MSLIFGPYLYLAFQLAPHLALYLAGHSALYLADAGLLSPPLLPSPPWSWPAPSLLLPSSLSDFHEVHHHADRTVIVAAATAAAAAAAAATAAMHAAIVVVMAGWSLSLWQSWPL